MLGAAGSGKGLAATEDRGAGGLESYTSRDESNDRADNESELSEEE